MTGTEVVVLMTSVVQVMGVGDADGLPIAVWQRGPRPRFSSRDLVLQRAGPAAGMPCPE
jgi:hypothetical protein